MSDKLTSRFFVCSDAKTDKLVLILPPTWWSRFYEYEWARQFCEPDDVALDAGCGICHPFKFYLADACREVHACDIDERILRPEAILEDIARDFGAAAAKDFPSKYFDRVHYARTSLTSLPYTDGKFDKIYCISVLEHLPPHDIYLALRECARTLKDNGLFVLTFDYPTIDLAFFSNLLPHAALTFAGDVSFELPANAIYSDLYRLYCFRAVLRKKR